MTKDARTCELALSLLRSWVNTETYFAYLVGLESFGDIPDEEPPGDELPDWIAKSFVVKLLKQFAATQAEYHVEETQLQVEQSAFDVEMVDGAG